MLLPKAMGNPGYMTGLTKTTIIVTAPKYKHEIAQSDIRRSKKNKNDTIEIEYNKG